MWSEKNKNKTKKEKGNTDQRRNNELKRGGSVIKKERNNVWNGRKKHGEKLGKKWMAV